MEGGNLEGGEGETGEMEVEVLLGLCSIWAVDGRVTSGG